MKNYRKHRTHHNRHHSSKPHHHGRHAGPGQHRRTPSESEAKFMALTAIDPAPRIQLEKGSKELTMRAMDLVSPIGMGQRGLIVAPPGSGKTTFLKHICEAVSQSEPEMKLYCLLVDERPEEVTDFRRSVQAEVHYSSSDETYDHHIRVADELMQIAFKEVAEGKDVMIVIDSLTRLARVHNAEGRHSGRTLSGGVDARALEAPRRIFGAGRNTEEGGSLTILATILVDTGSRMDQVIFEEFKGTGNMEIFLSREIANHRIFPAIDLKKSRTRKEERLFEKEECESIGKMRADLASLGEVEAAQALIEQLKNHATNQELLDALRL